MNDCNNCFSPNAASVLESMMAIFGVFISIECAKLDKKNDI